MADFEDELNALFLTADPASETSDSLAVAAMAQIEREDRRRSLILTTGVVAGIGGAALAILRSGAIAAVRDITLQVPAALPSYASSTLMWGGAAVALAIYGVVTFRPARAL